MRILVAVEAVDFRNGIDGLARVCKEVLKSDPFSGALFIFRNRRGTAIKCLVFDGQGYWLMQKRLSTGRFRFWPVHATAASKHLEAHELQVLLAAGNPETAQAAPAWRRVSPPGMKKYQIGFAFRFNFCYLQGHGREIRVPRPGNHRDRHPLHPATHCR